MMDLSDVADAMVEAEVEPQKIAATLRVLKRTRSSAAIRQARYRANKALRNGDVTDAALRNEPSQPVTNKAALRNGDVTSRARVKSLPPEDMSTGKGSKKKNAQTSPRDVLLGCLKPEIADAVIDHRRRMHCALNAHTAQLLVNRFNAEGNPNDNANTMMERGWKSFKLEWEKNAKQPGGGSNGTGRSRTLGSAIPSFLKHIDDYCAGKTSSDSSDGDKDAKLLPGNRVQRS